MSFPDTDYSSKQQTVFFDAVAFTRENDLLKNVTARFLFHGSTAKPTELSVVDLTSLPDNTLYPGVNPLQRRTSPQRLSWGTLDLNTVGFRSLNPKA